MPKTRRLSDAALVRRSQQGDRRAFAVLVGRYDWRLRGLAHALLLERQAMDAAMSTAFVRAWRDVVRINAKDDVGAWLYRVTYNACIDHLRRSEAAGTQAAPPATGIASGLASLPAADRVAVVLVDREGFTPDSAARILGVAPAELEAQLASARELLAPHVPPPAAPPDEAVAARRANDQPEGTPASEPTPPAANEAGESSVSEPASPLGDGPKAPPVSEPTPPVTQPSAADLSAGTAPPPPPASPPLDPPPASSAPSDPSAAASPPPGPLPAAVGDTAAHDGEAAGGEAAVTGPAHLKRQGNGSAEVAGSGDGSAAPDGGRGDSPPAGDGGHAHPDGVTTTAPPATTPAATADHTATTPTDSTATSEPAAVPVPSATPEPGAARGPIVGTSDANGRGGDDPTEGGSANGGSADGGGANGDTADGDAAGGDSADGDTAGVDAPNGTSSGAGGGGGRGRRARRKAKYAASRRSGDGPAPGGAT